MERRLAAILSADVIGYSLMMGENEAVAIGVVRDLKEKYLEPTVRDHGGEILKRMGDGWIIAFSSTSAAVQCAMETQTKLVGNPRTRLRIGAHIGEIIFDENDFHGAGVNLAKRLETEAPPGGLMISQDLHRQLGSDLAREFTDAGSFNLKNIALPVNGFQWRPRRHDSAGAGKVPSIAIESFDFAPNEPDTRAVVADLRGQLILRLSRRTGITVLDESSGRIDDSDYILRGRLRLKGTRGRFTLTLILRSEARPVWSETYQGDSSDIFEFCDQLVRRADSDLRIQTNAFDGDRIAHVPDHELSVSELRSRAANLFYKVTVESWGQALVLLDRALQLNPDDAMALAMHSEAIVALASARYEELSDRQIRSLRENLDKAVEHSPRSDYVFYVRGLFRTCAEMDLPGASRDAERALAISPDFYYNHYLCGLIQLASGDYGNAVKDFSRAVSIGRSDPWLALHCYLKAISLLCAGDPEKAMDSIQQAIQLRPNQWAFHRLLEICFQEGGNPESAKESETRASTLPKNPSILAPRPPLPSDKSDLLGRLSPRGG